MDYSAFQGLASSEKITLAILSGSQRVRGFIFSGGVYSVSLKASVIDSVFLNSTRFVVASSVQDLTSDSFFYDYDLGTLYIKCSKNPNRSFLVVTQKYFFSNKPLTLPHDLDSGFDVYFEPMVKVTSAFGTELDVLNEATSAIEGSGSITFYNDFDFWKKNFDSIFFENQIAEIYSWSSILKPNQAKLLFRGYVDSKTYDSGQIKINIKDLLYNLRATINLNDIADLELRNDPSLDTAKQRLVYGALKGHRPVNVDKIIDGSYPVSGTVALFFNQTSVVGSGTKFKKELIQGDKLIIGGISFTIAKVISDTALELTSAWTLANASLKIEVSPSSNKSYINREWILAGHSLSQPVAFIQVGSTTQRLFLNSTKDMFKGDDLYIGNLGEGELVKIGEVVNDKIISLSQSTEIVYPADTPIHRPCVQNVRMNDLRLVYGEDYTVDPNSARLSIAEDAEEKRAPLIESVEKITVVNGDDFFTGNNTNFTQYIKPGNRVRPQGTTNFFSVLEVTDNQIKLTEPYVGPSFTGADPLPEITSISGLTNFKEKYFFRAGPAVAAMQGAWFKIWDQDGSVAVWLDLGNIGTEEPEHNCNRSIEIRSVDIGDNASTVLKKIAQMLNADEQFSCEIIGDYMIISNVFMGVRPAAIAPSNGFEVFNQTKDRQRVKCAADVGESLDETFITLFDETGTVAYWFAIDDNPGAQEPSHGADRSVKVSTVSLDDDVTTVRNKLKAQVELDGFTCVDLGIDSFIAIKDMLGPSIGSMPETFSISVSEIGKSAWDLNGHYFVLPKYPNLTIGFWFDIDAIGAVTPPTGASSNIKIDSIFSGFNEEEIFEEISNAVSNTEVFDSEYSEGGILVTDIDVGFVSTELSVGTSGFIMNKIQRGISDPEAGKLLQYKSFVFGDSDILSCDLYGKTVDGLTTSPLIKTAPEIVRDLLKMAGSEDYLNLANFESAKDYFNEEMAFCVPEKFGDKASDLTYRDVINSVNNSVLGVLLQNNAFELEYSKLKPSSIVKMRLDHTDILDLQVDSSNKNMLQESIVEFGFKEYDFSTKESAIKSVWKSSGIGQYVLKTNRSRVFNSICTNESDAQRLANRWSFLLEYSSNVFSFKTKLQTAHLQINDIILIDHPKLYSRIGSLSSQRILMIESIAKKGDLVEITAIDLSNAFNRVAKITNTDQAWEDASDETKLLGGFYKDSEGMINGDPNSFDTNLIW